jgi:hypothetical protein
MLNPEDFLFLLVCAGIGGALYYLMVIKKQNTNKKLAEQIVKGTNQTEMNQDIEREEEDNEESEEFIRKRKNVSSKQEAKKQARKEAKRREKEVSK